MESDDYLSQYHTGSLYVSSFLHYPALPTERPQPHQVARNPAHSDFGTLTLLFQRDIGGLEIADMSSTGETKSEAVEKSARFIHAEPKPGAILVNIGYLMMRWTNGRWKNTVHRVATPPLLRSKPGQVDENSKEVIPERYSIAFFGFPDAGTVVEPLAQCCTDEQPKRWKPINAGEYLLKKRAAVYS